MQWETFFTMYGKEKLQELIDQAYLSGVVYPKQEDVLRAYDMVEPEAIKVVLLGQDPYILEGQAHGLAFSIYDENAKVPPTLKNIFKELAYEYGVLRTKTNLSDWAQQGVFLLNTILTVEAGSSLSHKTLGWQDFTTQTIKYLNQQEQPICYILLGNDAQKYEKYITNKQACILKSAHPSPLAAYRGFFGSNIFKQANDWLLSQQLSEVKWI